MLSMPATLRRDLRNDVLTFGSSLPVPLSATVLEVIVVHSDDPSYDVVSGEIEDLNARICVSGIHHNL